MPLRSATHERARALGPLTIALTALVPIGCSGPGGPAGEAAPSDSAAIAALDDAAVAARRDIEALVRGMNAAIDIWDGPAYVAPLDTTSAMVFIGSDATEVSLGYDAIAPDILQGFEQARQGARSGAAYRHTGLSVSAERDGASAWWVQSMDYAFEHEGAARSYPFRISGFALRAGEDLTVVLAHASLPLRGRDLRRLARPADPDPAPEERPDARGADAPTAEGNRGVRALVRELAARRFAGDAAGWLALFADEPDVLVVGAGGDAIHAGRDAVAVLAGELPVGVLPGSERDPGRFLSDSLVVHTRGDHAWWYQSGRLRFGAGAGATELPWRSTGAAVRRDGAWWALLLHDDVPVPNDSTLAFSEPVGG